MLPKFTSRLLFIFLITAGSGYAQAQTGNAASIIIGQTSTLHSAVLNEERRILISLPSGAGDTYFSPRRYPVVYLLDADSYFSTIAALLRHLEDANGGNMFPGLILVGICNTDRNRDLTPTHVAASDRMDSISASHTGGGEKFLSFIGNELIPHIDSLYPTAPYRIFIGHSLGGLTVINALIHHTDLFNAYIATEPSMFWDNQLLLDEAKVFLRKCRNDNISLFLGIANSPRRDMPAGPFGNDTMMIRLSGLHYHSILTLHEYLSKSALRYASKYYPDYDHGSSPIPAAYDGLRFLFNDYDLDLPFSKFFQPGWTMDTLIAKHYRNISRRLGFTIPPPEPFINNIAYALLNSHQQARAFYFFRLNIESYPASFNVYDSMGDYYLATGDKTNAIANFKRSLSLRETAETRGKLDRLQTGK